MYKYINARETDILCLLLLISRFILENLFVLFSILFFQTFYLDILRVYTSLWTHRRQIVFKNLFLKFENNFSKVTHLF